MITLLILLFIIECCAFCYLFYKILEIKKDIDILYNKYAEELEKVTKVNLAIRKGCL